MVHVRVNFLLFLKQIVVRVLWLVQWPRWCFEYEFLAQDFR
jgi:hypothetical protein